MLIKEKIIKEDIIKEVINIILLVCVPAMTLFLLMLINYELVLKTKVVKNIYGQTICLYGIPLFLSLCYLPIKLTSSTFEDIGICFNKKGYQNLIAGIGIVALILLFLYENGINTMEGAYVIQFVFVGIGEEVFFRAVLYNQLRHLFKSDNISMLIVAIIFGYLFHSDGGIIALLLVRMPLSILFSLIYRKTGSLSIPIILHGIYDILA